MNDINNIVLVGRLVRDCELKQLTNTTVCNFSIAFNRSIKMNSIWTDDVNFIGVQCFGKQGEALQKYLLKGRQVAVSGCLSQQRWKDEMQNNKSRIVIISNNIQLLGNNPNTSNVQDNNTQSKTFGTPPSVSPPPFPSPTPLPASEPAPDKGTDKANDFYDDDIPF